MRAAHDGGELDLQYLPAPEQSLSAVHWHTPPEQCGVLPLQPLQLAPQWLSSLAVQAAQVLTLQYSALPLPGVQKLWHDWPAPHGPPAEQPTQVLLLHQRSVPQLAHAPGAAPHGDAPVE